MNNRPTRAASRAHAPGARTSLSHATPSHSHVAAAPPPQPLPQALYSAAPNAALLIDFDNVTMGIRSELAAELKSLLTSDVVKGKIAIRRAYADWRRYPQYVLPLTETSIDLIYAPAYGSARKNATDIRLAIDAMELVFTRPEIGTIVLLSGDSDFSSLVIKLKEYGKYVIGVGIRESSSDLLVQNCDEYYSYNALAGLVRAGEEPVTKWDPWELVSEAIARMKRNGDVMRADRLKQVMQEIDSSFDEKNLSMSKFSRFVTEAAQRGLLHVSKLDNGQLEVDLPRPPMEQAAPAVASAPLPRSESAPARPATARPSGDTAPERPAGRGLRGTRSARGRGRAMRGEPAPSEQPEEAAQSATPAVESVSPARPAAAPSAAPPSAGERLTRSEAFDLLQRSVNQLTDGGMRTIPAARLREKARELLGRDSDTLSERYFSRILQDAHDADIIDVRRRGDDYEIARAVPTPSLAEQLGVNTTSQSAGGAADKAAPAGGAPARLTSRSGRAGFGKKLGEAPPDLLSIGVVDSISSPPAVAKSASPTEPAPVASATTDGGPPRKSSRARGGRKKAEASDAAGSDARSGRATRARGGKGRKSAAEKAAAPEPDTSVV